MEAKNKVQKNGDVSNLTIDAALQRQLKARCAELGCTMREKVETLISRWLVESGKGKA